MNGRDVLPRPQKVADLVHTVAVRIQQHDFDIVRRRWTAIAPANHLDQRLVIIHAAVDYHDLVHTQADHGYAIPDRDIFDKTAAERDWERIFAIYYRQLRPFRDGPQ